MYCLVTTEHMVSVPGSPRQLVEVLTLHTFTKWGGAEVHDKCKVDVKVAMQEGTVRTTLLAMHSILDDGLDDATRTAIAVRDKTPCVQPYMAALSKVNEKKIMEIKRAMQCMGVDMKTPEGPEDFHQLAVAQEVEKEAKGKGAQVVGGKPLLLGSDTTMHLGWKRHVTHVAPAVGFSAKVKDKSEEKKKLPQHEQKDE